MSDHEQQSQPGNGSKGAPAGRPLTQRQRRLRYGLNVGVLVLATLAIVVLVNWIAHRRFVRLDMTETRRYSLSEQTTGLLGELKTNIKITTLYAERSRQASLMQRVQDLLEEYERRSGKVEVERIDPTTDVAARQRFIDSLTQRYKQDVSANREALKQASQVFEKVRSFTQQQAEQLPKIVAELPSGQGRTAQLLRRISQIFSRYGQRLKTSKEELNKLLEKDMPNFSDARSMVTSPLNNLTDGVLKPAIDQFNKVIDDPNAPGAVKDKLIGLKKQYQDLSQTVSQVVSKVEGLDSGNYDQVRNSIRQNNAVVVTADPEEAAGEGPGVAVLTLDEIYPNLNRSQLTRGQVEPAAGYKGEQAVTGAVIQLTMEHNTKVVFVNPGRQPVLSQGPRQQGRQSQGYSTVAEQLRQMNFEVTEWQPGGGGRRQRRPQPKPTAEEGQTMVFVGLPSGPQPRRRRGGGQQQATQALQQHAQQGRPVLKILAPASPMSPGQSGSNPLLKPYGIKPQSSRVVMSQRVTQGGRRRSTTQLIVDEWPSGHPVAGAMAGLRGVLVQGVPLNLPDKPPEGVKLWPLIQTPEDTWADSEFFRQQQASKEESDPTGPFTVAAAGEQKNGARLIVIGDRIWATDRAVNAGPRGMFGNTLYSAFPANAELFTNSIYWLSGLEKLIAPSARTQEVRRIAAVSRPAMIAVWWLVLAGLPVLCLGAGGVVWFARRQ